ncbi:leucine carboxyl methyltransferase [Pluteus cervinus]|uniref:Leucine carboxyl methyltransferase n=1 Tax=Pluteus cervinus TaxID=181527 RepID=A0ACD3BAJ0_9AGAR|nr:leucine carboxyl methyltransferase [Pluteus cervinus]
MDPDASVRQTDTDAAGARLSAVQKGYFIDPFIKNFVPRAHLQPPRPPLINVGTFMRSTAIDDLVDQWLSKSTEKRCQIVSLGSGSDTRFWRIATGPHQDRLGKYIEIDFPEVTTKKAMTVKKSRELATVLGEPTQVTLGHGGAALHSPRYHLIPADLRHPPDEILGKTLTVPSSPNETKSILSPSLPTLLLFECVLVYMTPEASSGLVRWFVDYFATESANLGEDAILGAIVYEMFGLNDPFGRIMVSNLKARNVTLPGAEPYHSIESLPSRFLNNGFSAARALTLHQIRQNYVPTLELERIAQLEMLDEVEELNLVLEHYAITWGLFLSNPASSMVWSDWGLKQRNPE